MHITVVLARFAPRPPLHTRSNRGTLMTGMRWARLQEGVDCKMRRGAWYRVPQVTGIKAIVEVNRQPLAVPSYAIEIVATPPRCWTVVPLPRRASRLATELGPRYGVCPSCRHRARLEQRARAMTCTPCHGPFQIARDRDYLPRGSGTRHTPPPRPHPPP